VYTPLKTQCNRHVFFFSFVFAECHHHRWAFLGRKKKKNLCFSFSSVLLWISNWQSIPWDIYHKILQKALIIWLRLTWFLELLSLIVFVYRKFSFGSKIERQELKYWATLTAIFLLNLFWPLFVILYFDHFSVWCCTSRKFDLRFG
jgi:hypothetical protein